jgi:predicted dienelactone hydrolase
MSSDSRLHVVTKDALVGPPKKGFHMLFANMTDDSMTEFVRTTVLSARPELKGLRSLCFKVTQVMADEAGDIVTSEATNTKLPLVVLSHPLQLQLDKLPCEEGQTYEVRLSRGFA